MTGNGITRDTILARFPRERRWLLPALQAVQEAEGFLANDAVAHVGAHLRVPASEVYGVASDYPEFRLTPPGRHRVRVCTGVTCTLLGGATLLDRVTKRCPPDVTVEAADCFFECSTAPLAEIDGAYHGRLTPDDAERIEQRFRDGHPRWSSDRAMASRPPLTDASSARAALDRLTADARSRAASRPPLRVFVQMGVCGRSVGSEALLAAVRDEVARRGLHAEVVEGACNGMCYAAPLLEIEHAGWPRFMLPNVSPAGVRDVLDRVTSPDATLDGLGGLVWADAPWRGLAPIGEDPFWQGQTRVLMRRAGAIDPENLDDALLAGAYGALATALDGSPADVIAEVKRAGLQGRGGAFFPAAVKWEACRGASGAPKYLVMNGEEGEPGIFKDRHLMEADPHQVLEGALIAAYAAGASHVILYVHGEANLSAARLVRAVAEAEAAGIAGDRVLGREIACSVEILRGAGGFVLGEETALLESIEGRRAQPRTRPPFPVESGLWGKPTVINNVETLSAVPSLLAEGADRFIALGTAKAPGTKVFGLSGPMHRPGVVEVKNGVTLRALLQAIGGGTLDGRGFLGAVVGGPSGSIVPEPLFDVPMEPRGQVSPGTGGIAALPSGTSVVDVVRTLLGFNARESCGKCTPCREGAPRLLAMLDDLCAGRGALDAQDNGADATVRALADAMQYASLCGLGQAAPLSLLRALEAFPAAFRRGR